MYPKARYVLLDMGRYDAYLGPMKTHRDVIDAWPGKVAGFAADIGIKENHAKQMRKRNSIASDYWLTVEEKGKKRGVNVAVRDLARMKGRAPRPKDAGAAARRAAA